MRFKSIARILEKRGGARSGWQPVYGAGDEVSQLDLAGRILKISLAREQKKKKRERRSYRGARSTCQEKQKGLRLFATLGGGHYGLGGSPWFLGEDRRKNEKGKKTKEKWGVGKRVFS